MSFVVAKVRKNSLSRLQQNYFFSIGPLLFHFKKAISLADYTQASPVKLGKARFFSSGMEMGPKARSYFAMFSSSARNKRLACSGARMTRDCTGALGIPGSTRTKSSMNSELEWVMMARLEKCAKSTKQKRKISAAPYMPQSQAESRQRKQPAVSSIADKKKKGRKHNRLPTLLSLS